MDKLERRLKEYDEYNRAEISGEFLQRLKSLEPRPEAKQPRLRYVLPIAAVAALAVGIAGWAILRTPQTDDAANPGVSLGEPTAQDANSPAEPSTPEEQPKTEMMYTSKPPDEEPSPALPIFAPKPVQDGTAQPKSGDPAAARSEEPAPVKPNAEPVKPEDTTPAKPEDATPAIPEGASPVKPDKPTPVEPDNPNPPEETIPPEAENPDPPVPPAENPPQIPPYVSPFGAVYQMDGDREILTVTLLATGESVEIDVGGWMEQALLNAKPASAENPEHQPGETPVEPKSGGAYLAFGTLIMYQLRLEEDGTVYAEAFDPKEYAQYYAQYLTEGKENDDET